MVMTEGRQHELKLFYIWLEEQGFVKIRNTDTVITQYLIHKKKIN